MFRTSHFLVPFVSLCLNVLSGQADASMDDLKYVKLFVLGTVQHGGAPHLGCSRSCCTNLYTTPDPNRKVVSLGIVDNASGKTFLIEASPDLIPQWHALSEFSNNTITQPSGIFITHAHIGHYTGLMYLGRESLNTKQIPVYAMPNMTAFLSEHGPWNQLIALQNITLQPLISGVEKPLTPSLSIMPFEVPHRDEYSETVGFVITGPSKKVLFIPDTDNCELSSESILSKIKSVDIAFIDATFYNNAEVGYREVSEIPHPFVEENISLFKTLCEKDRNKIHFIHMNHTNPLLNETSEESAKIISLAFNIPRVAMVFKI